MPNSQKLKRPTQHRGHVPQAHDDVPVKVAWITQFGVITVALFTCLATVIGGIVASPYIIDHFLHNPTPISGSTSTPSPTPTSISGIQIVGTNVLPTELQSAFETSVVDVLPSESEMQTQSAMMETPLVPESLGTLVPPVADGLDAKMLVRLNASLFEGKSPLSVNFNARDSYVQFGDGSTATCGQTGFCTFMWAVYRDQKQIVDPFWGEGIFNYIFRGKGIYSVTVYVCRANACADDGISVTVR